MLPTPLGCRKMTCKFCDLLDEVSYRVEGGLSEMASIGTASILHLTISVMAVTVVVIAAMVSPFVPYKV